MFENLQGINPMFLSAYLVDYKNKQYFTNMKMTPTILRWNIQTLQWIYPMGLNIPRYDSYFYSLIN